MNTRTKILLFMAIAFSAYLLFILALTNYNQTQLDVIIRESRDSKSAQLDGLLEAVGKAQKTLASDYSYWDDMVSFVKTGDKKFARENIDASVASFLVDGVWVFDPKGEEVHFAGSEAGQAIRNTPFSAAFFDGLYRNRFIHFFVPTPAGLLELHAATIHPTTDPERVTEPQGFFIVARFFDDAVIADLEGLLDGRLLLRTAPPDAAAVPATIGPLREIVFAFDTPLLGFDGVPVAWLDAQIRSVLAERLQGSFSSLVQGSVAFGIAVLGVLFVLLYIFVSRPLQALSRVIEEHDVARIKPLEKDSSEFGKLARTVDEFFSQQVKMEQERARSEALLESLQEGIIGIDRNWNIVFANSALHTIFGIPLDQLRGRQFRDKVQIVRARDREEDVHFIERALLYGKTASLEEDSILLVGKREIPIAGSAAPISGSGKTPAGAVIILRDITEENQTRLLRSDFAYASHQLRTPVTEAIWAVGAALEARTLKKKNKDLSIAARSIQSVRKLIEHLLEVSYIDQEIVLPKPIRSRIGDIIEKAVAQLESRARERGMRIAVGRGLAKLTLKTDPQIAVKIVHELLDNAIVYGIADTAVEIDAEPLRGGILISVKGPSRTISEKELPLLFTKFFRGSGIPDDVPGAGLGLYIAREYGKLLGGKLWFTTADNVTSFFVLLPKGK